MQIKSIVAAAAIALAATVGSAVAAETFDTLRAVPVELLSDGALDGVRAGDGLLIGVGDGPIEEPNLLDIKIFGPGGDFGGWLIINVNTTDEFFPVLELDPPPDSIHE